MPPRNIPPISAPDTPNPWLNASASTSRAARTEEAKAKAREEQRSATTKDHVIEMLGEFNNLPVSTPADPEHRDDSVSDIPNNTEEEQRSATTKGLANKMLDELKNLPIILIPADPEHRDNVSDIPNKTEERFDWPNDLIDRIKQVMGSSCSTPSAPEFKFEISTDAMQHNLAILEKYEFDLGKALDAQHDSPLGPGMEFRPPDVLRSIFGLHPLWNRMENILKNGSKWPLEEISEEDRASDLQEALIFGNHKGASSKSDLLKKLISKDVKFGYSLPIPLESVTRIKGLEMAPMNIMAQNTIDEFGRVVPKDRLTHDQSWKWSSSGSSVNSRVKKELLQETRYGFCIRRIVNWAVAARRRFPGRKILATKIDYKSAYRRGILHFATALKTATQLPDDEVALITLRLTFGGAPCPFEWGVISETICDLANELVQCDDWDPANLHASVQNDIPLPQFLDDDIPFAEGRELIVDIPVDPRGKADVYIDDTTGLTVDIPGSKNIERMAAAIPLAIEVAARPNNPNEPIPREKMVAEDKLKAEGGLSETKTILGWLFNFRTLTVSLPEHKHIAWSNDLKQMIQSRRTTKKQLESTIGRLGHVGYIIPWVFHYLSRLRTLLLRARKMRSIKIDEICVKDLELMQSMLDKAKKGIDMNLLAFRSPDRIYYSDSCPAGLGGYSDQGFAWRFQIPEDLQFRASNNLLEFLAAIITPWIDIIQGRLKTGDCALSMTDSTTAEGWMRKSNFVEPNEHPVQAKTRVDAARKYASIFLDADIKGYSQWFEGKKNNVADALSRDWHLSTDELTFLLHSHFPEQMQTNFQIFPLPKEISSWLTSLLQQLPVSAQLQEHHTTTGLVPGSGGKNGANPLDATTSTLINSANSSGISYSELLPWLSGRDGSRKIALTHWLKAQSEVPSHMWYRPFGNRADRIPRRTQTTCLASFYQGSSGPIETTIPKKCNKRPFHLLSSKN